MKDIFIADAHLVDPDALPYRHLVTFLNSQIGQIDHLVLLGDIFEFWVGYKHCVFSAYLPLLTALQQLRQSGTKIVVVEGNHDFHMGPFFSNTLDATIIPDSDTIQLGDKQVFLCHGDTLTADTGYLYLRRFFRSKLAQILIRTLPTDTTWKIGDLLGRASRKRRLKQPPKQYILPTEQIINQAQFQFDQGCNVFMCGHFHQAWQHNIATNTTKSVPDTGQLFVLGNWGTTCHYGVHENGIFSLTQYQP